MPSSSRACASRARSGSAIIAFASSRAASGVHAPGLVDLGQLDRLDVRVAVAACIALELELALEQLGLHPHRVVLPRRHRDGAGDEPGEAGHAHDAGAGIGAGDAEDEADVRHQAVGHAEHRGAGGTALHVAVVVAGWSGAPAGRRPCRRSVRGCSASTRHVTTSPRSCRRGASRAYRAGQVWDGLHRRLREPAELTDLPAALRAASRRRRCRRRSSRPPSGSATPATP